MFLADSTSNTLYKLDTTNAGLTQVGPYGTSANIVGLAFLAPAPEPSVYLALAAGLGLLALATGHDKEAADYITKAIGVQPNQPVFLSNLAAVHRKLGQPEQALACLARALALTILIPCAVSLRRYSIPRSSPMLTRMFATKPGPPDRSFRFQTILSFQ